MESYGVLTAAIIAVTAFIKQLAPKVAGVVTPIVAALLGLAAGFAGLYDLTPLTGTLVGIAASGVVTVADRINVAK